MEIGVCKVRLHLPENHSLKGKRSVVKSIIARVKNNYSVSIAEIEDQYLWQIITLGVICVSNSSSRANEVISKIIAFIENSRMEAELVDYETEIVHVL